MIEVMHNILKAIKDNTHIYEDSYCEEKFKYVNELEITRAVLTIFSEYNDKKMKEITAKLMELKEKEPSSYFNETIEMLEGELSDNKYKEFKISDIKSPDDFLWFDSDTTGKGILSCVIHFNNGNSISIGLWTKGYGNHKKRIYDVWDSIHYIESPEVVTKEKCWEIFLDNLNKPNNYTTEDNDE